MNDTNVMLGDLSLQQLTRFIMELNDSTQRHLNRPLLLSSYDFRTNGIRIQAFSEKQQYNVFLPGLLFDDETTLMHSHDYYEFMIVLRGSVDIQFENQICHYKEGDCCLPNQSIRHAEICRRNLEIAYICVKQDYFDDWPLGAELNAGDPGVKRLFEQNGSANVKEYLDFKPVGSFKLLNDLLTQLKDEMKNKRPGYKLMEYGLIERIIGLLSDSKYYICSKHILNMSHTDEILADLKSFIESHYVYFSRTELEKKLHYNRDYLNRLLKEGSGMTIGEYMTIVRMRESTRLLIGSGMNIDEIAEKVGFANKSQFYRQFCRTYGITPAAYRKEGLKLLKNGIKPR